MNRRFGQVLVLGVILLCLSSPSVAAPAELQRTGMMAAAGAGDHRFQLESGALYWAGQSATFDGSGIVPDAGNASVAERTFRIRTVTDGDRVGSLVREFVVGTDGERVIDTTGLQGRYVIRYEEELVYVHDGTGYTSAPPDGRAITVRNSSWEVARQTISATWSADRVFRHQQAELNVFSNRASSLIAVSARGLEFDDLVSMFDARDFADDHDARADDDVLLMDVMGDTTLTVRFREIPHGDYTLVIEVVDTDARTTATIRVGARPPSPVPSTPTSEPTTAPVPTPTADPSEPPTEVPGPTTRTGTDPATSSPTPASPSPPPGTATSTPGQPGFGAGLAGVAVAIYLLVGRRRRG